MSRRLFEMSANWRFIRSGFKIPSMQLLITDPRPVSHVTNFTVFLPQDKETDVIEIRDWLHSPGNEIDSYDMVACLEYQQYGNSLLRGIKFIFDRDIDAAFFRLRWSKTRTTHCNKFMEPIPS